MPILASIDVPKAKWFIFVGDGLFRDEYWVMQSITDTVVGCVEDGSVSCGDVDGGGRCDDVDFSFKVSEWIGVLVISRVLDSLDDSGCGESSHSDFDGQ